MDAGRQPAVVRRWKYAPPPRVLHDAIVNDGEKWLPLLSTEARPVVSSSQRPDTVRFEPWVIPDVSAVELRIKPEGAGSALTVSAFSGDTDLSDEARLHVRHRLGVIFGAALRQWVDEPHW